MDLNRFQQLLLEKKQEIAQAMRRTLPVKLGRLAKDHYQDNFRQGGFVDVTLSPWKRAHRQQHAKGTQAMYSPLVSGRQNLCGSIYYHPADYSVTVGTSVPSAEIHNEGGDIKVTARMKRFFWAKYREANGGAWTRKKDGQDPSEEAQFWKGLALKPVGSVIHIPQRKFIGESQKLKDELNNKVEEELGNILSSDTSTR